VNQKSAVPKDAAAVILLNEDASKVLWAQRNPKISFLGGWHAFPGGKTEAGDSLIEVRNAPDRELARFIVCAARELFEETGVLLVRGGGKLTRGQRASLHDDLVSGRSGFAEILADWGLSLGAEDFFYTGHWTTPKFSPVRFKTRFFIAKCPPRQKPYAAISEMRDVEFTEPKAALERWSNSEVLIAPPVLISLQELAKFETHPGQDAEKADNFSNLPAAARVCGQNLLEKSRQCGGAIDYLEINPRVIVFPLKTKTLPPATHTNCFIVGRREFVVVDAASHDEDEQMKLFELIGQMIEKGGVCREIIVSHLHQDHFGGETALKHRLFDKFGMKVPISAHRITTESLRGKVSFEKRLEDGERLELKDHNGRKFELEILHTPGHARGHLCFYDAELGFLLSSDNVIGTGTVVIAPPEGDLTDYLNSLERMKNLPNLRHLCGSHGSAVFDARGRIEEYIAHRKEREKQVLEALREGVKTPEEIARKIYQKPRSANLSAGRQIRRSAPREIKTRRLSGRRALKARPDLQRFPGLSQPGKPGRRLKSEKLRPFNRFFQGIRTKQSEKPSATKKFVAEIL
jgi:glyoxylase-like metal-dependent hydrolase (beta-lactamase superfamily II)/8-oxo-dGTP pyrophosphatase MutT (NUDIX family)